MNIDGRPIGPGHPAYLVAEMSGNHGGQLSTAKAIIRAAQAAGADAIKLQTYRADTITLDLDSADFRISKDDPWCAKKTLFHLYEEAFTPWEWHAELFSEARRCGLTIFSSPFDSSAVDFLEDLGCPAYKIASPEITDIPLLMKVAQTGKPVIVSTGLAERSDIELAVSTLRSSGCDELALLKCTASYPAPPESMNLATIQDLAQQFDVIAGLSDHTLSIEVPIASVAMGARIIEKHLMLPGTDSVDSFFSLDTNQFCELVRAVRIVEKSIGSVCYSVPGDPNTKFKARRSLYVAKPISKGEILTPENIRSVRPSYGLHPKYYFQILGKPVIRDLQPGHRLTLADIDGGPRE